jgi:hypothetical protein
MDLELLNEEVDDATQTFASLKAYDWTYGNMASFNAKMLVNF